MKQSTLILIILLFSVSAIFAQLQSAKEIQVQKYLTEAKEHIKNENWRESALSLGKIIELGGVPPNEFYFLLGKTFVRGKDFKNGKDLLAEYLSITLGKGDYQKEATELLEEVKEYEKGVCPVCSGKGWTEGAYSKCSRCYGVGHLFEEDKKCYGQGYEQCRICGGSGQMQDNRGRRFTCSSCSGTGKVQCPWCKGTGYIRTTVCPTCGGSGKTMTQISCKNCGGDGRIDDKKVEENEKR